jgi:hypothetical protein
MKQNFFSAAILCRNQTNIRKPTCLKSLRKLSSCKSSKFCRLWIIYFISRIRHFQGIFVKDNHDIFSFVFLHKPIMVQRNWEHEIYFRENKLSRTEILKVFIFRGDSVCAEMIPTRLSQHRKNFPVDKVYAEIISVHNKPTREGFPLRLSQRWDGMQ